MELIPLVAWLAAGVIAVVLLGFCAYELVWKAKRLRRNLGQLQTLAGDLRELQARLDVARERLSATGLG